MKSNRKNDVIYPIEEFMLGTGQRVVYNDLKDVDCRKVAKQCANLVDGWCLAKDVECWQKDAKYCSCRYLLHCVLPPEVENRVSSG